MVELVIGLYLDYYVEVGFSEFVDFVDVFDLLVGVDLLVGC